MDRVLLIEVIASIVTQAILIGIFVGWVKTSISTIAKEIQKLEIKQDKHNNFVGRMIVVEQSTASAHKRLDELKDDIKIEIKKED